MENIKKIDFDGIKFTVVNWKGEWCYIASEVCNYLEYPNLSQTLKYNVDDENKIKITKKQWEEFINTNNISGILFKDKTLNNQKLFSQGDNENNNHELFFPHKTFYLIKELGMYELIMKSQKPKAKDFQKFVYNMIKQLREDTGLEAYQALLMLDIEESKIIRMSIKNNQGLDELKEKAVSIYEAKEKQYGDDLKELERVVLLKVVDSKWMEHIDAMDELKNGIGLRAYGQKDPVVQYRFEGGDMFEEMIAQIKLEVAKIMLHVVKSSQPAKREITASITSASLDNSAANNMNVVGESNKQIPNNNQTEKAKPITNDGPKVGRNDPCPCGSGKKYKQCCGKNQ